MGTVANVLAGNMAIYIGPTGEALPAMAAIPTGLIATPSGNWVAVGFTDTEAGMAVEYTPTMEPVRVMEHLAPIRYDLVAEDMKIMFSLREKDVTAISYAISAITSAVTAAATSVAGLDTYGVGDGTVSAKALLAVGKSPEGFSRIFHAPLIYATGTVTDTYKRTADSITVEFDACCNTSGTAGYRLASWYDVTAIPLTGGS